MDSAQHTVPDKYDRLVWIDLEMTGLDPHEHVIVEIAVLVTDANLNVLGEGIDLVIHATDEELSRMDDYVATMHETNGLTSEIRASRLSVAEAEKAALAYIHQFCDPQSPPPLAGNSIATDRSFIKAHMPRLDEALHYRLVDVSSVKELARRWYPQVYYGQPEKGLAHRALADILESIRELDYYRRCFLLDPADGSRERCAAAHDAATERYAPLLAAAGQEGGATQTATQARE